MFLKAFGRAGLGVAGAAALTGLGGGVAEAATGTGGITDAAVLNFALNLEYLEAEFYQRAVTGQGLPESLRSGTGRMGQVTGGRQVSFQTPLIRQYAQEIAGDELAHVKFLRTALGSAAVAEPAINLDTSFTAAATAAGVIPKGQTFDPYANENNFLLAAFIFEDVGVTAYKGAAPLISNKTYLSAAAGILAVEAYHAANIRVNLLERNLADAANKVSAARGQLDNGKDQGPQINGMANVVPADDNGVAFGRTPGEVLNIVYLSPKPATSGGFFPNGVNGALNNSGTAGVGGGAGATAPSGGAGTGAGGTAGDGSTTNDALIGAGAALLGGAAVAGAVAARHRTPATPSGHTSDATSSGHTSDKE